MLACQSRPRASATIKTALDERYCPPVQPIMQTAHLKDIAKLTPDMSEFTFETSAPARFAPGQYVLLKVTPEIRGARAYSMSNLPNEEGEWRLVVKHKPGGVCTGHLFNRLSIGDAVKMAGPYGLAYLRDGCDRDLVGVAGGSGVSPILSILRKALLEEPARNRQVHLFLGGRGPLDIVDPRRFADIRKRADGRLHFHPAISEPTGVSLDSWSGDRGFIHEIVAQRAPDTIRDSEVFVAGPPPMIRETLTTLTNLGVSRERVHFDNFF
jgi:toluene monooxygenase electron transfer component